jgi:hypothetical protein
MNESTQFQQPKAEGSMKRRQGGTTRRTTRRITYLRPVITGAAEAFT